MKLNDLSNPFNNFDITSWSTNLVDKINKTLKRRNREEDQLARPSKLARLDSDNITDNNGVTHDDHLHLTSTKLDDGDDILLNEKINDNNDAYDDDDDAKANDAYWKGEDPADDRDDNVLAKHEFDKGYNDDSESEDDEKVDEEEDELDREEDELDGEGYDEDEYESVQNDKIDPRRLPSYEEEVVGQVDSEDIVKNKEKFENDREQDSEDEPEDDEEDSQHNHPQEFAEHYNDYVYSDEEDEEEEDTRATTRNDAPIELSSDSE
ncbi:hypothetical protein E3Q22_03147 [Wallemia mellicola]|uniref:Uncharacterized protein n=1 Tax=Wallemia mellicola TaxID=1708541 RepID=A0A4T0P0D3_9BASI|nr:hypothetical protein E3Q22_03147 [Wallemia mellicola]TIC03396.1 hypothetical protein E3Q16_03084 [Wallemia mellicola]